MMDFIDKLFLAGVAVCFLVNVGAMGYLTALSYGLVS